jgi:Skp family chaperone for outer membrane proteins
VPAEPVPFPEDARIAFVDLQAVFSQSALGRRARDEIGELRQQLSLELRAKTAEMDSLSEKIRTQETIAAEAILAGWTATLRRLEREAQFATQEAQIQVDELQNTFIGEFERKVLPVIETIRSERRLLAVFSVPPAADPGSGLRLVAADRSLNLSAEVVRRLDGVQ